MAARSGLRLRGLHLSCGRARAGHRRVRRTDPRHRDPHVAVHRGRICAPAGRSQRLDRGGRVVGRACALPVRGLTDGRSPDRAHARVDDRRAERDCRNRALYGARPRDPGTTPRRAARRGGRNLVRRVRVADQGPGALPRGGDLRVDPALAALCPRGLGDRWSHRRPEPRFRRALWALLSERSRR